MKQSEPDKAAKALRDWERWHRRASDVGVSPPDPTVLLRALSSIMTGVLQEAAFRTSLIRNNLKLDTNPTGTCSRRQRRWRQGQRRGHLELLRWSRRVQRPPPRSLRRSEVSSPKVKKEIRDRSRSHQLRRHLPQPQGRVSGLKSEAGCKRGAECTFAHDWGQVQKTGRCLICSGTGPQKKDCPTKDMQEQCAKTAEDKGAIHGRSS